jgi:hypothetical protein
MSESETNKEELDQLKALLASMEQLSSHTAWDASFVLRQKKLVFEQQLQALKDQIEQITAISTGADNYQWPVCPEGMVTVFVSLYQMNGANLLGWEIALSSLTSGVVNRPVYKKEADVKQWVESRGCANTEAYVEVFIGKSMILDREAKDNLGADLVSLKQGAILLDHIIKFVHYNEVCFQVKAGKLLKVS